MLKLQQADEDRRIVQQTDDNHRIESRTPERTSRPIHPVMLCFLVHRVNLWYELVKFAVLSLISVSENLQFCFSFS